MISKRQAVLDGAFQAHPEPFVRKALQHPFLARGCLDRSSSFKQGNNSLNYYQLCLTLVDTLRFPVPPRKVSAAPCPD